MDGCVVGVDVATRWRDTGSARLTFAQGRVVDVQTPAIRWPDGTLTATGLADAIDAHARAHDVLAVALDGPQGWRDPATPIGTPGVGRRCERACATQGKVGPFGRMYPGTSLAWGKLCIATFDELLCKPGVELANGEGIRASSGGYLVMECSPTSAWRSSGLRPLPSKAKRPATRPYAEVLAGAYGLPDLGAPGHDDLQAIVAALVAMAVVGGPGRAIACGTPASSVSTPDAGLLRVEGLIWNVEPPLVVGASKPP